MPAPETRAKFAGEEELTRRGFLVYAGPYPETVSPDREEWPAVFTDPRAATRYARDRAGHLSYQPHPNGDPTAWVDVFDAMNAVTVVECQLADDTAPVQLDGLPIVVMSFGLIPETAEAYATYEDARAEAGRAAAAYGLSEAHSGADTWTGDSDVEVRIL